ncbi:MAG: RDD family protein [Chitinophagaceae bacterium]|nr:RDD family protein [Chitinophagaceae bacterium]
MTTYLKRLIGYLTDLVLSFIFYLSFFILVGLVMNLLVVSEGVSLKLHRYFDNISQFEDQLFTFIAFFLYLLLQDLVLKNKALSRLMLKLKLVNKSDNNYPGLKKLVIRNLVKSFFFIDLIYFVFYRKIAHDRLSGTVVQK